MINANLPRPFGGDNLAFTNFAKRAGLNSAR